MSTSFGVSYTSAVTGNRQTITLRTKQQAIREAVQLFKEGARNIDAFKYSPSVGAISFDWRRAGRFL